MYVKAYWNPFRIGYSGDFETLYLLSLDSRYG